MSNMRSSQVVHTLRGFLLLLKPSGMLAIPFFTCCTFCRRSSTVSGVSFFPFLASFSRRGTPVSSKVALACLQTRKVRTKRQGRHWANFAHCRICDKPEFCI